MERIEITDPEEFLAIEERIGHRVVTEEEVAMKEPGPWVSDGDKLYVLVLRKT